MLGLSRGVITGLIASGFVAPSRGPRNEYRFTFQDVVLLRTARRAAGGAHPAAQDPALAAQAEGDAARRAAAHRPAHHRRRQRRHRARRPLAMAGRYRPAGDGLRGRAGAGGSVDLPAAHAPARGDAAVRPTPPPGSAAARHSRRATGAPPRPPTGASLALDPTHADAYLNLGALLCEAGAATKRWRSTTRRCGSKPARSAAALQPRHRARGPGHGRRGAGQLPRLPAPRARPRRRALQRGAPARAARRRAARRCATSAPTGACSGRADPREAARRRLRRRRILALPSRAGSGSAHAPTLRAPADRHARSRQPHHHRADVPVLGERRLGRATGT